MISTQANTYCSTAHKGGPVWNSVMESMRKQRDEETPVFWEKLHGRAQNLQSTDVYVAIGPSTLIPYGTQQLRAPNVFKVKDVVFKARRPSRPTSM